MKQKKQGQRTKPWLSLGWGQAQALARQIVNDEHVDVQFVKQAPRGFRYVIGVRPLKGTGFMPLTIGASWEDAIEKLKALKQKALEIREKKGEAPVLTAKGELAVAAGNENVP